MWNPKHFNSHIYWDTIVHELFSNGIQENIDYCTEFYILLFFKYLLIFIVRKIKSKTKILGSNQNYPTLFRKMTHLVPQDWLLWETYSKAYFYGCNRLVKNIKHAPLKTYIE